MFSRTDVQKTSAGVGFQHIGQRRPILGGRLFDYLLALKWVMDVQKTSAGLGFQHIGQLFPTLEGRLFEYLLAPSCCYGKWPFRRLACSQPRPARRRVQKWSTEPRLCCGLVQKHGIIPPPTPNPEKVPKVAETTRAGTRRTQTTCEHSTMDHA